MFTKAISPTTREDLETLAQLAQLKNFYLAGGTAAALHLGHRLSFDLDFFSDKAFSANLLAEEINKVDEFDCELVKKDTLLGKFGATKISFFYYPYPLISKAVLFKGTKVADLSDIGAMKLDAISDRGTKRDFIDLYFILKKFPLEECFKLYDRKYNLLEINRVHLLKSLTYFADAEEEQMPRMLKKVSWRQVKDFFENEALSLGKKYL